MEFIASKAILDKDKLRRSPVRSCDLSGESVDDVARDFTGRDHNDVETDSAMGKLRMAREPQFGRANHAALGSFGYRFHRLINAGARLDFDEHHDATMPRDDVDPAEWCFPAPGE